MTSSEKGVVKLWQRIEHEDEDGISIEIAPIRVFKGLKEHATAASNFTDGSIILTGADGSYQIWSPRKDVNVIGKVDADKVGCCGTKCVIY